MLFFWTYRKQFPKTKTNCSKLALKAKTNYLTKKKKKKKS